jgi:dTDP-3-amino-3,4,6-trideoxy-alpha-D-glucose transaminase
VAKGIVVTRQSSERILLNDFVAQWREVGADAQAALARVGESGWLILGREVKSFEAELAAACQVPYVVGCANGLDAIEIALRVLGIAPGDKVITTPLSAFATTLAIVRAGGVPVFVDVDGSGLIDLESVADALSRDRSIKFCVPVHLYGHALDAQALQRIAALPGVQLVEDCAQAIGAQSRGKAVGTIGAAAATSFYPTKNLGALGDGGALFTRSADLAAQAQCLRDYGQSAKYVHARLGMNSRLDELQAAILRTALLPRLPQFTARRQAIAQKYRAGLENPALALPHVPDGSSSVWHLFPVLVDGPRQELIAHLDRAGIGSAIHYPTLIPDQPALAHVRFERLGSLTMAQRFAESELSLPIHPYLSDAQVERVIAACNDWTP